MFKLLLLKGEGWNMDVKKMITKYSKLAYDRHLVGAAGGNVSMRDGNRIYITSGGVALRDMTPEDVIVMDISGNILDNSSDRKPSKETSMHLAIYKAKPEITSIIHAHPVYSTSYAVNKMELPILTASARLKLIRTPLVGYAPPGSKQLAMLVEQCVRNLPPEICVVLLESHGILSFSNHMDDCFNNAELAEETAKIASISNHVSQRLFQGRIVDLSCELSNGTMTYPGDPKVSIDRVLGMPEAIINVSSISTGSHSGTHVDAPLHVLENGADIAEMPLERFVGQAVTLSIPKVKNEVITKSDLESHSFDRGCILLISTGWEEHLGKKEYFENFPYVSTEAAEYLVERGIRALGLDIPSMDIAGGDFSSHKVLLSAGIPLIEALINTKSIVGKSVIFFAFPMRIRGGDGSPVRALAIDTTP